MTTMMIGALLLSSDTLFSALRAAGPSHEIPAEAMLYAPLIGSWDAEVIDHNDDGSLQRNRAEIHFAWVLEGLAIQDVWISPPRALRSRATPRPNRYGTTIRVYDPSRDVWRVTWINPVTGVENRLVGRKDGDDIIQEGRRDDGVLMRWSFREITPSSFHWIGEESVDEGKSWKTGAEFLARRARQGTREALWSATDDDGFEHVLVTETADGFIADGVIVRRGERGPYRATYRLEGDGSWRVRRLSLANPAFSSKPLELWSDGEGNWRGSDHEAIPVLEGCIDVDIQASPFTNTLAIRRLALDCGESADIDAVFLRPQDLTAQRASQRYTFLERRDDGATYRYESRTSGFQVDLPVDGDGLLLAYPGYFRRMWP
jgi:hypothetical protein